MLKPSSVEPYDDGSMFAMILMRDCQKSFFSGFRLRLRFCLQRRKSHRTNCTVRNVTPGQWASSRLNCELCTPSSAVHITVMDSPRAGFTLSGALKKMWGPLHLFFPRKNWRPFLVITVRVSAVSVLKNWRSFFFFLLTTLVNSGESIVHYFGISGMQTIRRSFCGAPFLWGPLFGRTCWTCLNPPLDSLTASEVRGCPSSLFP